jgi:hypothetical protein
MGNPNRPVAGERIQRAQWVAEAVRLAGEGWSSRDIAERLSKHHSTVCDALNAEYERARPTEAEVRAAREMKRTRLYRGLQKWTQVRDDSIAAAEANPDCLPDYKAGELVLKHESLLAAVEGTDAPKLTELSGKDGAPLVSFDLSKLSDEQLERLNAGDIGALSGPGAGGAQEASSAGAGSPEGTREPA